MLMVKTDLVLLAAGSGSRLSPDCPKQYIMLGDAPMFIRPLRVFDSVDWIGQKIVVHPRGMAQKTGDILDQFGISNCKLVEGGKTRQESVSRGLKLVQSPSVVTHNAAVALVSSDLIEQLGTFDEDCVTTAMPLKFNLAHGDKWVHEIVDKEGISVIDSPQVFKTEVLRSCHKKASEDGFNFNSDAGLMIHYGRTVLLVPGSSQNFKITTPIDLAFAEFLLDSPPIGLTQSIHP